MLDAMALVSGDEFSSRIRDLIVRQAELVDGPVGLYAEREVAPRRRPPDPLFQQSDQPPRRAEGLGPPPVASTTGEVGSEGVVATLITSLCRSDKTKFFNHTGPDLIRSKRIRKFMLITDLIGSGRQADRYISAAWSVASIRSWNSFGWFDIEVVAYAASKKGKALVQRHPSSPRIYTVKPCPTVFDAFGSDMTAKVKELCIRYNPDGSRLRDAFGYGSVGALIAFAHFCLRDDVGPALHAEKRGFTSVIGLRHHLAGLVAFARQIEPEYSAAISERMKCIRWPL